MLTAQGCAGPNHHWRESQPGICACGEFVLCAGCHAMHPLWDVCPLCAARRGDGFRTRWRYVEKDQGLSLFTASLAKSGCDIPAGGRVLEIGCSEADWMSLAKAADPTLDLWGIDWRRCQRPGTVIHGDVLQQTFEPQSFDAIVSLSAIEHIGLGYYSGDPKDADGDTKTLQKCREWLKPGGLLYLDVPYTRGTDVTHSAEYRLYNDALLQERLLKGWTIVAQHFSTHQTPGVLVDKPTVPQLGFTHYTALWLRPAC